MWTAQKTFLQLQGHDASKQPAHIDIIDARLNICSIILTGDEASPRPEPGGDAAGAQLEPDDADQAAAHLRPPALVHHPRPGRVAGQVQKIPVINFNPSQQKNWTIKENMVNWTINQKIFLCRSSIRSKLTSNH